MMGGDVRILSGSTRAFELAGTNALDLLGEHLPG
jgi:hypothetical protein